MTESSTYSPVLSWVRVDEQAAKVAISIRSTKQWIAIVLFFIAVTPICNLLVKVLIANFFQLKGT